MADPNKPVLTEDQKIIAAAGRGGAAYVAQEVREQRQAAGIFTPQELAALSAAKQAELEKQRQQEMQQSRAQGEYYRTAQVGVRGDDEDKAVTQKTILKSKNDKGETVGYKSGVIKVEGMMDGSAIPIEAERLKLERGLAKDQILDKVRDYLRKTNVFDPADAEGFLKADGKLLKSAEELVKKQTDGDVPVYTKPIFESLREAAQLYNEKMPAPAPTTSVDPALTIPTLGVRG